MDGTTTMQGTEQEVQNTATETQGQQTAESTPEKVSTLQKFIDGLFGGGKKAEGTEPEKKDGDPAAEKAEEEKSFTQADVDAAIEAAKQQWLSTSREAFDILEKIDSDNVKILFDIYHQQITEGNLYSNIFDHLNQIGHFHAAAVPGRGPITGGEINYTYLLQELADNGYDGYVGLEYMTAFSAEESLKKVMENILV